MARRGGPKSKKTKGRTKKRSGGLHYTAARTFNYKLTQCDDVAELLAAFMAQTSFAHRDGSAVSAATHLAGANRANSVNFSTCLHRLARFAGRDPDERKRALQDPRFALLACSAAEMAAGCNGSKTVAEAERAVALWGGAQARAEAGGDPDLREADEILRAIAGSTGGGTETSDAEGRAAKAGEAMALLSSSNGKDFSSRERSNVCWALAKLRLAPPSSALPPIHAGKADDPAARREDAALEVVAASLRVRGALLEEARRRRTGEAAAGDAGGWIPELSRLAARVLDLIGERIAEEYRGRDGSADDADATAGNSGGFNPQEMASALWAFAKSGRGDAAVFDAVGGELARRSRAELERCDGEGGGGTGPKPQELSNTIWAFATAGIRGDTYVELVEFVADALDGGAGLFFGAQFKPQELSNTAWALATLHSRRDAGAASDATEDDGIVRIMRWVARSLIQRIDSFKPQEIANSVWAFSTVGFGYDETCGTNAHGDYAHAATGDPEGDKELVHQTLEAVAENALSRLDRFKGQELNNLAWGFARLGHRTERAKKLFAGVGKELIERTWQFKPQDVATTLWSFATAEHFDLDAFRAGASRLNSRHIRAFKPQEMSNTIWALATAGFGPQYIHAFDTTLVPASQRPTRQMITDDPITECFAAVASETMRRTDDFKDQELKDVLWSFSKIGVRHPSLFKKMAKHIVGRNGRGFSGFSSQGLGNTLWSFAKQAQLSLEVIDALGGSVKLVSTGRLAVYETSCLDIGESVIKQLFWGAAEAGLKLGLDRFTNQDLSNTVWAYSTLGLLHTGFFKQTENEVVARLQRRNKFQGQEIANILWSFATLNAQPEPTMVDALSKYVAYECRGKNGIDEKSIARLFNQRQELANLAWSCAVVGRYPRELMNILYIGLVGRSGGPERMKEVFNDQGLQKSSIMTLYYVQVAADVEAPDLRLSLPVGFPNGWGEDEDHEHHDENDLIRMSSSMLTLTVSKLQREVSDTFRRIGFDNILEHVIDTNEIKDEYGIQLPRSPKDFLSIDIANIENQLGVEVDGPGHFVRLIDRPSKLTTPSSPNNPFSDRGENRVNGPTMLKHRLLTHLGWDVIHLPYWEYQNLGGDREKEEDYCQSLLEQSSKW